MLKGQKYFTDQVNFCLVHAQIKKIKKLIAKTHMVREMELISEVIAFQQSALCPFTSFFVCVFVVICSVIIVQS